MDLICCNILLPHHFNLPNSIQNQSHAVIEAFIRLFDENLIYRSNVPVSWSCWLQSTISDVEIENQEIEGPTNLQVPGYESPITFGILTSITYKGCENGKSYS